MREVVLVDGVGRPKLHEIPDGDGLSWPDTIGYADPESYKRNKKVFYFKWSLNEIGPEQRPIYRLLDYHHAPLRLHPDYFRKQTIGPLPKLRVEDKGTGPCAESGS